MSLQLMRIMLVEKEVHMLAPGEATYSKMHHAWLVGCPGGHPGDSGIANLAGHDVIYDEQAKLLTVSPSILCDCGAHYFIERNQIRWC